MATLEDLAPEARDELALLARELSDNPETRKSFLGLTRKVRPNIPVPELELDERLSKAEQASAAQIEALQNKLAEKEMREELARRRQKLIAEGKAQSEEDIARIEKLMLEKGISNHETAADYDAWMSQAATPTPQSYNRNVLDPNTRKGLVDYWKNPVGAARDAAARALDEFRKNPRVAGI